MRSLLKRNKDKAWDAFSLYIRKRASNSMGMVKCYTCPTIAFYREMQTGHWIEGHGAAVYINEDYVRPQCVSCNMFHGGQQGTFRDRIRKELGDKKVDALIFASKQSVFLKAHHYKELEEKYKRRFEQLF